MGRKKTIDDETLMRLIQRFYHEECNGNPKKLKIPEIAEYVAKNGYPAYQAIMLRRNTEARAYIDSLKQTTEEKLVTVLAAYKTLDIESFLDANRTTTALRKSLVNLDNYYKSVADSATEINKRYKALDAKYEQTKEELSLTKKQMEELKHQITLLKEENNTLKADKQALRTVVEDYVYPDIANELLAKEGVLSNVETTIDINKLADKTISADTKIVKPFATRSGSSAIQNIFNKLEE